jgi:putative DNA methylase
MTEMTTMHRKKLIEVALPLAAINEACVEEKAVPRHGHPSTLHLWWARRPLAACRAVLFAQLVDDPSSWPSIFPTEEDQDRERQRLFDILTSLVSWDAMVEGEALAAARLEIARSFARAEMEASGPAEDLARAVLQANASEAVVARFLREVVPPVHDPFAGGGSIPGEASRLGLRAVATDLNPVAVLLNKAQIELPTPFAGRPPVLLPEAEASLRGPWRGLGGIAADVRICGERIRQRAAEQLGEFYESKILPKELGGGVGKPIAYLWARTVASPDPAFRRAHTPLVSNLLLSEREGRAAWVEIVVDRDKHTWTPRVAYGQPADRAAVEAGTKSGRGSYRCVFSPANAPIDSSYLRAEGMAGRLGRRLLAVVVQRDNQRLYISPTVRDEELANAAIPRWVPDSELSNEALGFRVQNYGIYRHADLFLPRQLTALSTFSALVRETADELEQAYLARNEGTGASQAGRAEAAKQYADAVAVFLACAVSKLADWSSMFCGFIYGYEKYGHTFGKQTLSMLWDFAELNPLSDGVGNWLNHVEWVADAVERLPTAGVGRTGMADAAALPGDQGWSGSRIFATDPPYYDNIGYSDLSDFFYVWLRHILRERLPGAFPTMLVPKNAELVAAAERFGGDRDRARSHFEDGLRQAFARMRSQLDPKVPISVYYAFKQSTVSDATDGNSVHSSTGWEAMLAGLVDSGFEITGTWPIRSERTGRLRDIASNALASSIVLICRARDRDAPTATRADFRRELRTELRVALRGMQRGNIAPVDVAQAAIGPGMAIFSRHARVLEADGSPMPIRSALQLINEALDEFLSAQEGDADAASRFAVKWFETVGWESGAFGEAEKIALLRNVSVEGMRKNGIVHSGGGSVRLKSRSELPSHWSPNRDPHVTVWEATQHLIKRLEEKGEPAASALLVELGPLAEHARDLAYRLYSTCERKAWAEDARAFNGLVIAWPELERLAAAAPPPPPPRGQLALGIGDDVAGKPVARRAKGRAKRA